jgi:uncharacterized protein YcaQ
VTPHHLSRTDARRIAVQAQYLARDRPAGLLDVVRRLTLVQVDNTDAVAPSADLVLWSRLGADYAPEDLESAVANQALVELRGFLRPAQDLAMFRADMADWPGRGELTEWQAYQRDWVAANDACRQDVLEQLRADGPLPARELVDSCVLSWRSSGWTNNRNVSRLLEFMEARGEVAVAQRQGRERWWDLAERIYPDDEVVPFAEARHIRAKRWLRALGIARVTMAFTRGEPKLGVEVGEPAVVEGTRGKWWVDPEQLDQTLTGGRWRGRAALLSPLDQLVFDRKRMTELFEFDYQLEMYKPASQRRWGYYALPILYDDRLVGKVDATADREHGVLHVDAVHADVPFTKAMTSAVNREIDALAAWLNLALARND